MSEEGKVLYMKKNGIFFNSNNRDQIRNTIYRAGIDDMAKAEDVVDQIEQIICTSMVAAAKNVGHILAEKAFKVLTQRITP